MSVESAIIKSTDLLTQNGRAALHTMYPKEFEMYMCALELIDQTGATLRYFVFPVMPSSIEETRSEITNIKKTLSGVVVLSNTTFIPRDIIITGNFGRKFKTLLGSNVIDLTSSFTLSSKNIVQGVKRFFDERVKTGYGCYKILEEVINDSKIVDENGARKLLFYNLALGNSYLVTPISLKPSMSQETNMIWNYTLVLKAIAPLEAIQTLDKNQEDRVKLTATGYVQTQTNQLINTLSSILL